MKQNVFSRFHFIVITGFISSYKTIVRVICIYNFIVCNANWKKLVKQGLGLIVQILMFPYTYELKNKFQLEEEGIGNIFLLDFGSRYSSRLHKIS